MDKNYVKKFQKKIWKKHLQTALISLLILIVVTVGLDWASDGIIIDMLEKRFGHAFASTIQLRKYQIVFGIGAVIVICNFMVVERYALHIISDVFTNIGVVFNRDEEKMDFHGEFKELEEDLNVLKADRNRAEKLAAREAQRRTDILAYLAHDIKTPLASVIGYLCLLEENPQLTKEEKERYLHLTLEKANRVEQLMNEFFDVTRFNLENIPLELQKIDISYMLEQMVEEFYPMLTPGGRSTELQVQKGVLVYIDPDKTARVFNNILKNAITYSDTESVIRITAKADGKYAVVTFENNGPDIPHETLNRIFDKFYRVDSSRSSKTGGAGLGLAIAKEIVEQHGGSIDVESENHWTCFTVRLPLAVEREEGTGDEHLYS